MIKINEKIATNKVPDDAERHKLFHPAHRSSEGYPDQSTVDRIEGIMARTVLILFVILS